MSFFHKNKKEKNINKNLNFFYSPILDVKIYLDLENKFYVF